MESVSRFMKAQTRLLWDKQSSSKTLFKIHLEEWEFQFKLKGSACRNRLIKVPFLQIIILSPLFRSFSNLHYLRCLKLPKLIDREDQFLDDLFPQIRWMQNSILSQMSLIEYLTNKMIKSRCKDKSCFSLLSCLTLYLGIEMKVKSRKQTLMKILLKTNKRLFEGSI